MKYQIYKITNLLEPQRVYIGMTSQTLKERFKSHCSHNSSAMYAMVNTDTRPLAVIIGNM